ncbi:hypothetical protein L6164_023612 [Bauhinia variegata]|uniref:Uncharacterized protein n=1 Tax=Bauhinia variegata TaxID=167791 RepID=A0ACB9MJL9_BAUVA|nr:hypothetical protein L6164_023612 [Bauhinia variegata]
MCSYANKKRRDVSFGSFPSSGQNGQSCVQAKLPEGSRVHSVFHVSQLKAAVGQGTAKSEIPIELEQEIPVVELEELLKHRTINRINQEVSQVLVKWKNLPLSEAT